MNVDGAQRKESFSTWTFPSEQTKPSLVHNTMRVLRANCVASMPSSASASGTFTSSSALFQAARNNAGTVNNRTWRMEDPEQTTLSVEVLSL
jgi:hypothetical protein